jgi:HSP20 family protein
MAGRSLSPWRGASPSLPAFQPFLAFRDEFDRLFDDFFSPERIRSGGNGTGILNPCVEVNESDKSYTVTAELPGLDMNDIHVDLNDNVLAITGEKKSERQGQEAGAQYSERSYGKFERRIPLSQEIEADKVEAAFKNGVLRVELPKNPKARDKSRHIQIKPD